MRVKVRGDGGREREAVRMRMKVGGEGGGEGYNVREIVWERHSQSEKDKYWDTMRQGEQVTERNWEIEEEMEGKREMKRGGKGGSGKREREGREREMGEERK